MERQVGCFGLSLAHIGFALTIFGAVISTSQKDVISTNQPSYRDIGEISDGELSNEEFILLYERDTVPMGEYAVTYVGRKPAQHKEFFEVEYYSLEQRSYSVGELVTHESLLYACIKPHTAKKEL